jgi:hypothetical protein
MTGQTRLAERSAVTEDGVIVPITSTAVSIPGDQFFEMYQYVNANSGYVSIDVPALNFFSVIRQNPKSGRREVYFDIHVNAQPDVLFRPPAGAHIQRLGAHPSSGH